MRETDDPQQIRVLLIGHRSVVYEEYAALDD